MAGLRVETMQIPPRCRRPGWRERPEPGRPGVAEDAVKVGRGEVDVADVVGIWRRMPLVFASCSEHASAILPPAESGSSGSPDGQAPTALT